MPVREMSEQDLAQHRQREQERRDQFARDFPGVAMALDQHIARNLPPGVVPSEVIAPSIGRNDEESELLNEVNKVHRHMAEVGTIPATFANLHPWPIVGCGRYLMYVEIPACPIGQNYQLHVFRHYHVDLTDKGGRFGADPVTPIVMVNDLFNQLENLKRGGAFGYLGDHLPGERPQSRSDEIKRWEKAKEGQLALYRKLFREGEGFFHQSNHNGLRNITENHRLATQWLLHYKYITNPPAWLSETVKEGEQIAACPRCGNDPLPGAFACTNCAYILDAYAAYTAGEIEDTHHSLRRLKREQLNALGLDFVPTMEEYRVQRRQKFGASEVESSEAKPRGGNGKFQKKTTPKPEEKPDETADED